MQDQYHLVGWPILGQTMDPQHVIVLRDNADYLNWVAHFGHKFGLEELNFVVVRTRTKLSLCTLTNESDVSDSIKAFGSSVLFSIAKDKSPIQRTTITTQGNNSDLIIS